MQMYLIDKIWENIFLVQRYICYNLLNIILYFTI